ATLSGPPEWAASAPCRYTRSAWYTGRRRRVTETYLRGRGALDGDYQSVHNSSDAERDVTMRNGIRLPPGLLSAVTGRRLLAALLLLSANGMTVADTAGKDRNAWWSHIRVLASDEFQGRLTGSTGYQQAATYVADRFRQYGLMPAGDNGYFQ